MPKFRKKPVVVNAYLYTGQTPDQWPKWLMEEYGMSVSRHINHLEIVTLEGTMKADHGDYIIQGVQGEIYPCKPSIFEATYEPA